MSMGIGLIIIGIILYLFLMVYFNQSTPGSGSSAKTHTISGIEIDDATFQKLKAEATKKGYNVNQDLAR